MSTAKKGSAAGHRAGRWRLQDAKARFSEVVREAQRRGPQRVTLHGKDAVVVVGADEFDDHQIQGAEYRSVRGWLLDTNVVSDLRKPKPDSKVINFIAARPGETCFLPTS